nr:AMP-binding protein [Aeromonas caviae]
MSFLGRPPGLSRLSGADPRAPAPELGQTERRCRQLASALRRRGIGEGDTVSIVAPNVPAMFEAHFGVPMSGAVLNTINTRLDADAMAFIFQHAQSKVVLVDREFGAVVRKALSLIDSQPW